MSGGACEHACAWPRRPEGSKYLFFNRSSHLFLETGFLIKSKAHELG